MSTVGFHLLACLLFVVASVARAEVQLHPTFSDHAVLQRDLKVPIWGTAADGEKVTVEFAGQKRSTVAKNGHWMVTLRPLRANAVGGVLKATGPSNSAQIQDVVVGEVWVCSGQSNMEWPMSRSFEPAGDIAASANPNLRLFTVTKRRSSEIKTDLAYAPHAWVLAAPDTVRNFSAVGYYFGRDLVAALKGVPVGIIHTSWGGSPAEVWMRLGVLEADSDYRAKILEPGAANRSKWEQAVAAWEQRKKDAEGKGATFTEGRPGQPWQPGELYAGMLANIIPYGIRGAIWYQGESNAGQAWQYRRLFADMIKNWRADWGQGDFPFYAVQLAPWDRNKKRDLNVIAAEIVDSDWAQLREAQNYVAKTLPKVDVAVITDVGDKDDIHPTKKAPVGERLARLARAQVYGEKILAHGPRLKSSEFNDSFVRLTFADTGKGLMALNGATLTGFIVAGSDQQWHPAQARIDDAKHVVVQSDAVSRPVAVRYGWNDYPVGNLANSEGLPASPFRTDTWPVSTQPK
ncbi:MAG TPA: sialate O-acetylesterase [Verrucomicrobiota bacterium]|nr:sialate O-acetylesterase [Verrucomicrobiota bacterium]